MILPYTEQHSFTVDGVLLIIIIAPRHHRPSTSQLLSLPRYVPSPNNHYGSFDFEIETFNDTGHRCILTA